MRNLLIGCRPRSDIWLLSNVGPLHLLPESYLFGLTDVRYMSYAYTSFLFGKIYPHGVWFYFPAAFAIKSSLAFLSLFALSLWAIVRGKLKGRRFFSHHSAADLLDRGHGCGHEYRRSAYIANLCVSDGAGRRGQLEIYEARSPMGGTDRWTADFSSGLNFADIPGIRCVRQRTLGWAFGDLHMT